MTEIQNAHNDGRAAAIRARHGGDDPDVFKTPAPDACAACIRLHIGPDGHPRIFKLSVLEGHGDNSGRKRSDWRAVKGAVHPHCACELSYRPPGWGFDEDGDLVPGGEYGISYDAETIEKSIALEDAIQKAARVGGSVEVSGLRMRLEPNAGEIRRWNYPMTGRLSTAALRFAHGELVGSMEANGKPVSAYVGPDPTAPMAFVVDQRDLQTGAASEQKLMLGFRHAGDAERAYLQQHPPDRFSGITAIPAPLLKSNDDAAARAMTSGRDELGRLVGVQTTDRTANQAERWTLRERRQHIREARQRLLEEARARRRMPKREELTIEGSDSSASFVRPFREPDRPRVESFTDERAEARRRLDLRVKSRRLRDPNT